MRARFLAFAIVAMVPAHASADAVDPSIGKVEVTLDLPKDKPYIGEMIMLRMRSFIRADVVLDDIRQPPLTNFNWQQLGRDKPIQAMVDGFRVDGLERDIAIYPQLSGRLIIDPFVRHVTIVDRGNQRVETDFASKPVYVDVQNYTAVIPPGTWWLPAKSVTITDNWSVQPDEIKPGTLAHRTIAVEAVGVTGDRLPPPPEMRAPGTIAFRGPVQRDTVITEDGPVGRGTYQWDLRPVSSSPAKLPAIHIPWFDTSERRVRDAALPSIWTAYVGTLVHPSHEKSKTTAQTYLAAGPVLTGLAAFAWMSLVCGYLAFSRRDRGDSARRRGRLVSTLRRAARSRDESRFHEALLTMARTDVKRWAAVAKDPLVADRLTALDGTRYGNADGPAPPLAPLAEDLGNLWLAPGEPKLARSFSLPPLDGDMASSRTWRDRVAPRFGGVRSRTGRSASP